MSDGACLTCLGHGFEEVKGGRRPPLHFPTPPSTPPTLPLPAPPNKTASITGFHAGNRFVESSSRRDSTQEPDHVHWDKTCLRFAPTEDAMRTPSRSSVNWGQENKHAEESQGTPVRIYPQFSTSKDEYMHFLQAGLKPPKSKSVPKVPSSQFKTSNDRLPRGEFMAYQNRLARNRLTLIDDIPEPSDEALTEGLIKYATRSYSREEKIQCLRDELAYTIRCNRANHGTEGANENFLFWTVFEFGDRFPHIVLSFARIIATVDLPE
ncbi:hypothetical protein B0H13DRAFT_1850162 [Mycena leptocephala]|nr:hypothetical protein B0H13DRAFT_1850162 [Mycena leptocephala]